LNMSRHSSSIMRGGQQQGRTIPFAVRRLNVLRARLPFDHLRVGERQKALVAINVSPVNRKPRGTGGGRARWGTL